METRTFIILRVDTKMPILEESTGLPVEFDTPSLAHTEARKRAGEIYEQSGLSRSWDTYGFVWQQKFTNDHYVVKPKSDLAGEQDESI